MDTSMPSMSMPSMSMPDANPFSDEQQQTMKEEGEKFLDKFGKTYLLEYKTALIEKVIEELQGKEPSPYKLREKEPAGSVVVVKTGWLTKRGDFIKNWKKRYFIVRSNGAVEYYAKDTDTKPKGVIVLEGYKVTENPTSDAFSGKQFFWTFNHEEEDKRVWHIFADGEEEKKEWIQVFHQATRVATGYVNPDGVTRKAFAKAYSKLRYAYGMYQKNPKGIEGEALSNVLYERLYDVVIGDVLGPLDGMAKKVATKFAKTLVTGLASTAWKATDESCGKLRPELESTLKKALGPFLEVQEKIKAKIHEAIDEKLLDPVIKKVLSPIFVKISGILHPIIIEAYQTQLTITIEKAKKVQTDLKDSQNAPQVFREMERTLDIKPAIAKLPMKRLDHWMEKIEQILSFLDEVEDFGGLVGKLKSEISDTIKPAVHLIFPPSIEENMIRMSKNSVYTSELDYKDTNSAEAAGDGMVAKLHHDMKLYFVDVVHSSLKGFVEKPYSSFVVEPATESLGPLTDEIPEELKDFIDPAALLEDLLEETLDKAVEAATEKAIEAQLAPLLESLTTNSIKPLEEAKETRE